MLIIIKKSKLHREIINETVNKNCFCSFILYNYNIFDALIIVFNNDKNISIILDQIIIT